MLYNLMFNKKTYIKHFSRDLSRSKFSVNVGHFTANTLILATAIATRALDGQGQRHATFIASYTSSRPHQEGAVVEPAWVQLS